MSAARHAYSGVPAAGAYEHSSEPSRVLPLLILVVGLAAATIWFVALPMLDKPRRAERSCEVFVLETGSTKCVPKPMLRSNATRQKPKPSGRPKH